MEYSQFSDTLNGNEIAIVGMACRFPGASDLDSFWQNLCNGVESISFFSAAELERSPVDHSADPSHPAFVPAASVLADVELFDAQFFGYAPSDAALIDPQQRLFLEYATLALEHAGYDPQRYPGAIGVFAGARTNTYIYNLIFNRAAAGNLTPFEVAVSNDFSCLSTRVAYKLNLRGPAYSIHTACSTGLSVVHLACQSVLIGECHMAIAGGIAVSVPQRSGYLYREGGIVSPDGHCRPFDASATGTVLGSGVGVVVLKRLEDALADGDTIHAIIKGSAANNDGSSKASFTAPGVDGQSTVITDALSIAGVDPDTISYIEAHGTGTHLGDPIEIRALTRAFRSGSARTGYCAIGSVKSNFGHLESAAGMAGLIKTILALKHKQIPPSLHFNQANPDIHFAQTPFYVNTKLTDWQTDQLPRRAGVSAFGIGGTNIHIILEEAPPQPALPTQQPWHLLPMSAKTASALDQVTANLAEFIHSHPETNIADIAHTLQIGRSHFDQRRVALCRDASHAVAVLQGKDPEYLFSAVRQGGNRSIVFMFAGQGAQYVGMAADLYAHEPLFREQIDICAAKLHPHMGLDIRTVLYPELGNAADQQLALEQTALAQPALFVVEYAMAQLLMAWGLRPNALIGHSIGEYVTACLAGVFSLDDALRLVALRGRLMQALPPGGMMTVALPPDELQRLLPTELELAAINAPDLCVVAGPQSALDAFAQQLAQQRINYRPLVTSHAFHSRSMEPILADFAQAVASINLHPPELPYISNLSGTWIKVAEATDPQYWAQHLRRPVNFAQGLHELLQLPDAILLDLGPARSLSRLAQRHPARQDHHLVLATLRHPQDDRSDRALLLSTVGRLWLAGLALDWQRCYAAEPRRRVPLPGYPFERQRYWIDPQETAAPSPFLPAAAARPAIADCFYLPGWKRASSVAASAWATTSQTWLLFAPEQHSFATQLIEQLEQAAQTVVVVYADSQYRYIAENRYAINPRSREDYAALAYELSVLEKLPQHVVHLWSLAHQPAAELTVETFDRAQVYGFYSVLFFVQAFGEYRANAALKLSIISPQIHDVRGDETLHPELATLLGACRVIPQEYPQITCRNIDIVVPAAEHEQLLLSRHVLAEIASAASDSVVALRGRHRWVQDLLPTRLNEANASPLHHNGVYLISGGLAGIGFIFATHLARNLAAKLILLEAEPLPPRETWQTWLDSYAGHDDIGSRIKHMRELEASGADILLLSADLADQLAVQQIIAEAIARFGPIHGVIHAATVMDGGLIALRSWDAIEQVFTAKAKALINLYAVLRDQPLDFMVLCSSLNTIIGEFGQIDQCAANCFLDLFAQCMAANATTPITTINWDLWQENSGLMQALFQKMALPTTIATRLQQEFGDGLHSAEGIAAFTRIIAAPPQPQVLVSLQDLQQRAALLNMLLQDLQQVRQGATFAKQKHARPALQTAYVAPRNAEEQLVAEIWQNLLGIEPIGIYDDFFELGGHSLLVTMIVAQLREALGVDIPMDKLFEKPTIAGVIAAKAELQEQQDSAATEILNLLAQLSDEEAEEELRRRLDEMVP